MIAYRTGTSLLLKGIVFFLLVGSVFSCSSSSYSKTDVLVIGGGTAGTAAALSSGRMGVSTILLSEFPWLGGMLTSAGVSAVDGNTKLPSGIWGEFRDSLIQRYGSTEALKTGWVSNHLFEPSVGDSIFKNMVSKVPKLEVWYNSNWETITKVEEGWLVEVSVGKTQKRIIAKELIDASELGDVSKEIGIDYYIGMDSKDRFNEDIAPLVPNDIIQDLTYVLILKENESSVIIDQPEGYDPSLFYCATENDKCNPSTPMNRTLWPKKDMINYGRLPGQKYMINWPINGNDYYLNAIEMSREEREIAYEMAKLKSLQFLYYLQTELSFDRLGIAYEEYPTKDGFPLMPYHRESRRVIGEETLTINDIAYPYDQKKKLYRTGIAVGDYPVDHHHDAHPEADKLPELHFYPVPSYSVPMGTLLPKNVDHFIVTEKSISVSNLVNGTTRLQPVVLQLGHASGIIASLAILKNKSPKEISVREVQKYLLNQGGYILPYLDVPKMDPNFKLYQRIGATGILRGTGLNVGWENQTWFYPDQPLNPNQVYLEDWLKKPHSEFPQLPTHKNIFEWLKTNPFHLNGKQSTFSIEEFQNIIESYDPDQVMTRGEFSKLIDHIVNPFDREIDISGNWKVN